MALKEVFDLWDFWSALPDSKRTEALAHLRALSEAGEGQTPIRPSDGTAKEEARHG